MIGYLVFRSGFLPRVLGVLMVIGGLIYMIDSFVNLRSPTLAARLPELTVLAGVAELASASPSRNGLPRRMEAV